MFRASRRALWPLALALSALSSGCAHETVADRQLSALEEGMNRDLAARDRADPQLDAVKLREEYQAKTAVPAAPAVTPPHTVELGVLPPPGSDEGDTATLNGDDPNDTSPRPVIRVVGTGMVRRSNHGAGDRIEETLPDEPPAGSPSVGPPIQAGAPPSSALDPNAKRSYDAALALVNARDYDHALDAFAAFLVRWPDHPNADNAMYWRGECYFAKGELARAAEEFEGAIKRFPLGNKVPDCLLKLGICEQKLGNQPKSQAYFDRLAHDYPQSEAARRIATVRSQGRDSAPRGPQETP
jgi:tol-pal system protein YbgF